MNMEYKVPTEKEEMVNLMREFKDHTVNVKELKLIDKIIKLINESEE